MKAERNLSINNKYTILSVPNQHKFSFFYQNGNNGEKGDVKFNFLTYMQEVDIINNYIL